MFRREVTKRLSNIKKKELVEGWEGQIKDMHGQTEWSIYCARGNSNYYGRSIASCKWQWRNRVRYQHCSRLTVPVQGKHDAVLMALVHDIAKKGRRRYPRQWGAANSYEVEIFAGGCISTLRVVPLIKGCTREPWYVTRRLQLVFAIDSFGTAGER